MQDNTTNVVTEAAGRAIEATSLGGNADIDTSLLGLFLQADIIVKVAMIILLIMSIWSWAIIIDKWLRLRRLRAKGDRFDESFWSGASLDDLYDRINNRPEEPMSSVFAAGMREWRRSASRGGSGPSLSGRIVNAMQVALDREMDALERGMTFLASVGSSAPFIGLFGTVWGIMNSFQAIALSNNTSLTVVAPGIAEALFATALGLVAAIPAVIFYNKLSNDIGRYGARLENFATEFSTLMSRQIEDRG
jgi:biopolymer transport protein TolQ